MSLQTPMELDSRSVIAGEIRRMCFHPCTWWNRMFIRADIPLRPPGRAQSPRVELVTAPLPKPPDRPRVEAGPNTVKSVLEPTLRGVNRSGATTGPCSEYSPLGVRPGCTRFSDAADGAHLNFDAPSRLVGVEVDVTTVDRPHYEAPNYKKAPLELPALPVPYPMTRTDRVPVQRYYDPEFYAMEIRAAVATGLADGVLLGRDSQPGRLRHLRDPGQVDHHRSRRRDRPSGRSTTPVVTAVSRLSRRATASCRAGLSVRSTAGATASTGRTPSSTSPICSMSPTVDPRTSRSSPAGSRPGVGPPSSTSTTTPRRCASPRAVRDVPRRVEGRGAASGVVGLVPYADELEARHGGVHGGLPRHGDPPAARRRTANRRMYRPIGSAMMNPERLAQTTGRDLSEPFDKSAFIQSSSISCAHSASAWPA